MRRYIDRVSSLDWLSGLPCLRELSFSGVFDDLTPLLAHQDLTSLLVSSRRPVNPEPLTGLPDLTSLFFYTSNIADLGFLRSIGNLTKLGLAGMQNIFDLGPLTDLVRLETLAMYGYPASIDFTAIRHLPTLNSLDIGRPDTSSKSRSSASAPSDLRPIIENAPGLTELGFLEWDLTDQIGEISHFAQLKCLSLRNCNVTDLAPLADIHSLARLQIAGPDVPIYLNQIKRLPQLRDLDILSSNEDDIPVLDLSPLGNRQINVHVYRHRHRIIGTNRRIKVKWLNE